MITKIEVEFFRYCGAYTTILLLPKLWKILAEDVRRLAVQSKYSGPYHLHDSAGSPSSNSPGKSGGSR